MSLNNTEWWNVCTQEVNYTIGLDITTLHKYAQNVLGACQFLVSRITVTVQ